MDILVVEDDAAVAALLVESLRLQGHTATSSATGRSALLRFDDRPPDAVFLDLVLPDTNGLTVLREIRRRRPETPVVVLTGHSESPEARESRTLGVIDVLQKPQILDNLAAALRKMRKPAK